MNEKAREFIKKLSYSISSNLISFIVSALVVLIVPKLIGVEEYGYWQLYLFYSSYIGFLHFGWNDGIYLRIGGEEYKELDKKMYFSQFIQLLASQVVIGIVILFITSKTVEDANRAFIISMVVLAMVITNTRHMLLYILQATSRIEEYAKVTVFDRVTYIVVIISLLVFGVRDYQLMIIADILGKFLSLMYSMYFCKDIVFNKISDFYFTIKEAIINIKVGINLMFSNIASQLIIGIIRFGVERTWDVATFGKVSLTLSVSNMMMIFINAIGIILYPILRRTNQNKFANIYSTIRDFLMTVLFGALIFYYPFKTIVSAWLPQYAESLMYMAMIFPMFIYEGKMALLINTYLKTMRREKVMLRINVISMLCSLVITLVSTKVFQSLDITILNIILILAFRSIISEFYLSKELNINVKKDIILEMTLTIVFIISGWFINSWYTVLIYGFAYLLYLIIKKRDLTYTIDNFKSLIGR